MEKKNYEEIISLLPQELKKEITALKTYIKTLKNISLKQKIIVSDRPYPHGPYQISFNSDYGFIYSITVKEDMGEVKNRIYLSAYNAHTQQQKFGVRKKNYVVETLEKIAETNPVLADKLFDTIKSCGGCGSSPVGFYRGGGCLHGIVLSYKNSIKRTCAASFDFEDKPEDFASVKLLLHAMDDVYGLPSVEKGFNITKIIYELPLAADKWKSECKDGLCDYNDPNAFTDIISDKNGLTIRPSSIAPDWRPYASCFPENLDLDVENTNIYFDFTSETKWRICLMFSDGDETQTIDFQSAIGSVPAGCDGCAGRHCGYVKLTDILAKPSGKLKLERIDISSTWLIAASKLNIKSFAFGIG